MLYKPSSMILRNNFTLKAITNNPDMYHAISRLNCYKYMNIQIFYYSKFLYKNNLKYEKLLLNFSRILFKLMTLTFTFSKYHQNILEPSCTSEKGPAMKQGLFNSQFKFFPHSKDVIHAEE